MTKTVFKNILFTRSIQKGHHLFGQNMGFNLTDIPFIRIELQSISKNQIDRINSDPEATWIFTSQNAVKSISKVLHLIPEYQTKHCYAVGEKTAQELNKTGINACIPKQHNSLGLVNLLESNQPKSCIYFSGGFRQNTILNFFQDHKISCKEIECYQTHLVQPDLNIEEYDAVCFCSPSAAISFFKKYKLNKTVPCIAIGNTTAVKLLDFSDHVVMSENTNVYSMLEICHNYLNT